ncbi:MAG: DUF3352 domain-containing protein [Actinomycetota bacterium]
MPTEAMEPTEESSRKATKRTLALVIAVFVVLGAGGAAFAFMKLRGSPDLLMRQVPAGADVVATIYLDPAASQKLNLFRMTGRFPVLGSESDLTQRLDTLLDEVGQAVGLDHNDFDWIGSQAAVVVDLPGGSTPNFEILIDVDDIDAAKATLAEGLNNAAAQSGMTWHTTPYKGVDVVSSSAGTGAYAFVGDTLVLGSTTIGVESIIDTDQGGASLADSADFQATSDGLPDGRLAFVFVNVRTLLPLAQEALSPISGATVGGLDMSAFQAFRGIGMTISAEPDGLALDINEALDPTMLTESQQAAIAEPHDNPLTSFVPPDAFGLAQAQHVDAMIDAAISQLETASPDVTAQLSEAGITGPDGLLSALSGDVTLEVGPGTPDSPVSGALILGVDDATKFEAAVAKLKDLATSQACPGSASSGSCSPPEWRTEEYKGTTISSLSAGDGMSIAYAMLDGAGAIGVGPDSIKALIDAAAGENITSSSNFTTAQDAVPSQSAFFYLDLRAALQTAASNAPDPGLSQALRTLGPIQAIAIGQENASDHSHVRFMILIP